MALSFYAVWQFKKYAFLWRPSWIYANCKNCPKLTACHSSQIGSMAPVKDRETKNPIALSISRSELKPFSSVIWTRKQRFLAHLSRRLTGELIVYPCSGVRPSSVRPSVRRPSFTISKIFSSETAWPIKAKLHVEGGTKVYINGPGHMTKMAAMAINSKNL